MDIGCVVRVNKRKSIDNICEEVQTVLMKCIALNDEKNKGLFLDSSGNSTEIEEQVLGKEFTYVNEEYQSKRVLEYEVVDEEMEVSVSEVDDAVSEVNEVISNINEYSVYNIVYLPKVLVNSLSSDFREYLNSLDRFLSSIVNGELITSYGAVYEEVEDQWIVHDTKSRLNEKRVSSKDIARELGVNMLLTSEEVTVSNIVNGEKVDYIKYKKDKEDCNNGK